MRKMEPLRSKVTGPLADLLRFLSLRRIVSDLGRLPAHPAELFDDLVKFPARLFIHAYGHNFHEPSVTRSVLHSSGAAQGSRRASLGA